MRYSLVVQVASGFFDVGDKTTAGIVGLVVVLLLGVLYVIAVLFRGRNSQYPPAFGIVPKGKVMRGAKGDYPKKRLLADPAENAFLVIEGMEDRDNSFDPGALLEKAKNDFMVLVKSWGEQNAELTKEILSPELWEHQKKQIDDIKTQELSTMVDKLEPQKAKIILAIAENDLDTVTVRVDARSQEADANILEKIFLSHKRWAQDIVYVRKKIDPTRMQTCPNCEGLIPGDVQQCVHCSFEIPCVRQSWKIVEVTPVVFDPSVPEKKYGYEYVSYFETTKLKNKS